MELPAPQELEAEDAVPRPRGTGGGLQEAALLLTSVRALRPLCVLPADEPPPAVEALAEAGGSDGAPLQPHCSGRLGTGIGSCRRRPPSEPHSWSSVPQGLNSEKPASSPSAVLLVGGRHVPKKLWPPSTFPPRGVLDVRGVVK